MERTDSPFPKFEENSFRARKQSAMEATKDAAHAISNREFERQQADVFDWMMQMKNKAEKFQTRSNKMKRKYYKATKRVESESALD
jgi:hypothetical protein